MKLTKLTVQGFRSLNPLTLAFDPLTVLIGENDAGKSSVLDLLDLVLNNKQPDDNDYHLIEDDKPCNQINVEIEFLLEPEDKDALPYAIGTQLSVKFIYDRKTNSREAFYKGAVPKDPGIRQDFTKLNAQKQKEVIQKLDPTLSNSQISNSKKRLDWWTEYLANASTIEDWVEIPARWGVLLPRFERYSAMDYRTPESFITKTLKTVYEQTIYEEISDGNTTVRQLIKPLQKVQREATERIVKKVLELKGHIKRYNRRITDINYDPKFDFATALQPGDFRIDQGKGLRTLIKTGDGTKRRMFMGILDWERTVTLEQASKSARLPTVIRGYDEPDTNLHYEAQRLMYQTISDIVNAKNSNTQAILCTHSLTMIDRAPTKSIRLFRLADSGQTTVDQLQTDQDPEVEKFLKELSLELGITNSIMFYERCFILVEGPTESNALPMLYKRLYGYSPIEDGIRIIATGGNSGVSEFLKLLLYNRKELLLIFVDKDCETEKSAKLRPTQLKTIGFDEEFINNRVLFIGDKEFEDAFSNSAIVHCLQGNYSKSDDSAAWKEDEIEPLRSEPKFSTALQKIIWEHANLPFRKPEFGRAISETCQLDEIPQEIRDLFVLARSIVGLAN